jgi:hypothetical protein
MHSIFKRIKLCPNKVYLLEMPEYIYIYKFSGLFLAFLYILLLIGTRILIFGVTVQLGLVYF